MSERNVAIVLAAGRGNRMNSDRKKQYLLMEGKPMLYYSLKAFQDSPLIAEIVLVTGKEEAAYARRDIVDRYSFDKVGAIVEGGKERYHSVFNGLAAAGFCDYILIQDAARPFLSEDIIKRSLECVRETKACVVGMPVKDTIKISSEDGYIESTPNRSRVWAVQTPQVFAHQLVKNAYSSLMENEEELQRKGVTITDDAMVVETFTEARVKLVEGSYKNIKITTREDLEIASVFGL